MPYEALAGDLHSVPNLELVVLRMTQYHKGSSPQQSLPPSFSNSPISPARDVNEVCHQVFIERLAHHRRCDRLLAVLWHSAVKVTGIVRLLIAYPLWLAKPFADSFTLVLMRAEMSAIVSLSIMYDWLLTHSAS